MIAPATRLLIRHFVRGYLSRDGGPGSEKPMAVVAAMLVSPGLFLAVLFAAKYVTAPFPLPVDTAVGGLFDRLLFHCASFVLLVLVALIHWDRLALDARDAAILGVLPLSHGQVVRAKWTATAIFGLGAAMLLSTLPSLIYPIVSVGRLEASWGLVLALTGWQFLIGVLAGATGFLGVIALRETAWAVLGPRLFLRISAALQGILVVTAIVAFFLLPSWAARQVSSPIIRNPVTHRVDIEATLAQPITPHAASLWLPPVMWTGAFETLAGRKVAMIPPDAALPRPIRIRGQQRLREYWKVYAVFAGSLGRAASVFVLLASLAALAAVWNGRTRAAGGALLPTRRSLLVTAVDRAAGLVPWPEARAGFGFSWRTLLRSQPHRLLLAVGLAGGLAAGTVGLFDEPPQRSALADASITLLSVQALLVMCVAAGLRAALRRSADEQASWIYPMAWSGARALYDTGVVAASTIVACGPIAILLPLYAQMFGLGGALTHALVGALLALVLNEALVLRQSTLPLVEDAPATDAGKALPMLAVPAGVMTAAIVAGIERRAPLVAIGLLLGLWLVLLVVRTMRRAPLDALTATGMEESAIELGLYR